MSNFAITDTGIIDTNKVPVFTVNTDRSVYEVIRLIEGIALFLEDHFARLLHSARISGIQLNMQLSEFDQAIEKLIITNHQNTGNIKFLLTVTNNMNHWSLSFIPHSYPTDNDYQQGVPTGLLYAERSNPEAKVIQRSVREKADQMIADRKLYEVLLVDRNGLITEGSRSNVFFIKGNRFYTAPAAMVLSGVTRKKVLECLHELNYPVIELAVPAQEVSNYEAVFLTGTSPKVLPIDAIDNCHFKTDHPLMKALMDYYNKKLDEYILSKKG
ncbi:MAG TPA: aminotransferase class IV [Prolixibacteraceae bacterium]|nr:aminotransferase class IV [Prolixibacteraceae bacterium]